MFHYFNNLVNAANGNALPGYLVYVLDAGGTIVPIYSDESGTPIQTVSDYENAAITDAEGNYDLYVDDGTYSLQFRTTTGSILDTIINVPMISNVALVDLSADDGATLVGTASGDTVQVALDGKVATTTLASSAGSNGVGFLPSGTGAEARTVQDKLRERISVKDFGAKGDAILDGSWNLVSGTDDTAAITAAITYVKANGGTLVFPGGTYLVSIITFNGSNYAVDTSAGVIFKQKTGVVADVLGPPTIVRFIDASNITCGDLNLIGNIATDSGEDNHGSGFSKCKNVSVGKVFARNVRGDAFYCYARNTSTAERQWGCYVASVSGTNVYRNLLTVTGGQVRVGAVINAGPVGYRDFDVEPNNASGTYEAVDLEIGYVKAGSCEITSDDPLTINHAVRIGILDCDFTRVQATTPPYPSAPGAGAYALGVSRTEHVQIGYFKARNYNLYPLSLALSWSVVEIGTFDVSNSSLTDGTFNTMILQQGNAQGGAVRIGTLICDAANTKYLGRVQGTGLLKIEVANIRTMKCLMGAQITGRFANGTIDINSSTGVVLANCANVVFENISTANHASATFTSGCSNVVAINSPMFGQPGDGVNMVVGGAVRVAGVKVLGTQQSAVSAPTGGTTIDTEGRAAINAIRAVLTAHGLTG